MSIKKFNWLIVMIIILLNLYPVKAETVRELFDRGNEFYLEKKYDKAIECYDKALELEPYHIKIWLNKAITFTFQGNYEKAYDCYNIVLDIEPEYAEAWHWQGITFNMHGVLERDIANMEGKHGESSEEEIVSGQGKFEKACECFDMALNINPNYVEAWHWKGVALSNQCNYEEAIKCFDKALEISPDYFKSLTGKVEAIKLLEENS